MLKDQHNENVKVYIIFDHDLSFLNFTLTVPPHYLVKLKVAQNRRPLPVELVESGSLAARVFLAPGA